MWIDSEPGMTYVESQPASQVIERAPRRLPDDPEDHCISWRVSARQSAGGQTIPGGKLGRIMPFGRYQMQLHPLIIQ